MEDGGQWREVATMIRRAELRNDLTFYLGLAESPLRELAYGSGRELHADAVEIRTAARSSGVRVTRRSSLAGNIGLDG